MKKYFATPFIIFCIFVYVAGGLSTTGIYKQMAVENCVNNATEKSIAAGIVWPVLLVVIATHNMKDYCK